MIISSISKSYDPACRAQRQNGIRLLISLHVLYSFSPLMWSPIPTMKCTAIITDAYIETNEVLQSSNNVKLGAEISRYVRLWAYRLPFCGAKMRQRNAENAKKMYNANITESKNAPHVSTRQSRWLNAVMRLGVYVPAKPSQLVIVSDGKMTEEAQQVKAAADAAEAPHTAAFDGTTKERLEHSIRTSVAVRAPFSLRNWNDQHVCFRAWG